MSDILTRLRDPRSDGFLNRRAADEIDRLRADRDACISFIQTEMLWCGFHGEMNDDSASVENAEMLREFLDRCKTKGKTDAEAALDSVEVKS